MPARRQRQEAAKRSCGTAVAYVVLFYILSQHQSGLVVEVYQQPMPSMGTHTRTRTRGAFALALALAIALTLAFSVPFHHSFIPSSRSHRVCHAVTVSLRAPNMAAVALRLLLFLSVTQLPLFSLGCFLAFPACCVCCQPCPCFLVS